MSSVIRTILHVSDLHLGDVDLLSADAKFDAQAFAWWQLFPLFDGYLGHTRVALEKLEDLLLDLQDEGHPTDLVVTGDLTTAGAATQLQTALSYIRDEVYVRGGTPLGLRRPDAILIPGNHDHWPGRVCHATQLFWCMCGAAGSNLAAAFPALPAVIHTVSLTRRCKLVIAALDSDSEVGPRSANRALARGSFVRHCVALASMMGPNPGNEVRVLLVHHSYVQSGVSLAMSSSSQRALVSLMTSCGFRILLTGHAHTVALQGFGGHGSPFQELRCGTTTARDFYDKRWLLARATSAIRIRKLPRNTALVHRIEEDKGRIYWVTTVMKRKSKSDRFKVDLVSAPLQVWP